MDRKSIIIIVVSVVLLFGWTQYVKKAYPGRPLTASTNTVVVPPGSNGVAAAVAPTNAASIPTLSPARGESLPRPELPEKTYGGPGTSASPRESNVPKDGRGQRAVPDRHATTPPARSR